MAGFSGIIRNFSWKPSLKSRLLIGFGGVPVVLIVMAGFIHHQCLSILKSEITRKRTGEITLPADQKWLNEVDGGVLLFQTRLYDKSEPDGEMRSHAEKKYPTLPDAAGNDHSDSIVTRLKLYNWGITAVFTGLAGLSVWLSGMRLSCRVAKIADAADRISLGALETEIAADRSDEIGRIAEAVCRMQDSLLFAMKRFDRRQDSRTED